MPAKKTQKRKKLGAKRARSDGWLNVFTGIGLANRDKRMGATICTDPMPYEDALELYRGDDLAAKIVDTIPEEMTREGFEVRVATEEDSERNPDEQFGPALPKEYARTDFIAEKVKAQTDPKEESEAIMAMVDEFDVLEVFADAMKKERFSGGSAIFVGSDDSRDMRVPLNENAIKRIRFLTVFDARELIAVRWYNDPFDAKYGLPRMYRVQPQTMVAPTSVNRGAWPEVHESRIIRFGGVSVSRRQQRENFGWGDSVLTRCNEILRDYNMSWAGIAHMLQDGWQGVLKMRGLHDLIMQGDDKAVLDRLTQVDISRSLARMMVIDAEGEEFERQALSLSGLPETMQQMALRLAAAANMPVMLLLGQPPSGLNATGKGDMQWWYDKVAAEQRNKLRPRLNRLLKLFFLSKNGPTGGKEPNNWTIKFNPLSRMTASEQADVRLKTSQADASDIAQGVLSPEEVAVSRFGGDGYSTETQIDTESRDAMHDTRKQVEASELDKRKQEAELPPVDPNKQMPPK